MSTISRRIRHFVQTLIDQDAARIVVPPKENASGFWYGGGNMIEAGDGTLYLTGRYRNAGDSRTGLKAGERGLELAIFRSTDGGETFEKIISFAKGDLDVGDRHVLSIEGTALNIEGDTVELFISTEKDGIGYPGHIAGFQKPGTGVWTIDYVCAPVPGISSTGAADSAGTVDPALAGDRLKSALEKVVSETGPVTLLESRDPRFLHIKDPVIHNTTKGDTILAFCTHPFNWSSSNSGYTIRKRGESAFGEADYEFFRRGYTWDVAATRLTDILTLPPDITGEAAAINIAFYDGAECLRSHDENPMAVKRPRGFSCEELGSAAWYAGDAIERIERIDIEAPLFVSPRGTGCSRYVQTLATKNGIYAMWQQSQSDGSQPLVMNMLTWEEVRSAIRS